MTGEREYGRRHDTSLACDEDDLSVIIEALDDWRDAYAVDDRHDPVAYQRAVALTVRAQDLLVRVRRRKVEPKDPRAGMIGKRVMLLACSDPYTRLEPGTQGTITHVDDTRTVHVRWDDGSSLGLVAEAGDRFAYIPMPPTEEPRRAPARDHRPTSDGRPREDER